MQAARGASLTSDQAHDQTQDQTRSRLLLLLTVFVTALVVDQVTKVLAVRLLDGRDPVQVVGELLQLTLVRNPGAAFSAGTGFTQYISIFAITATIVGFWFALRVRTAGYAWGVGLILAGIVGNLVDRIVREPAPLHGHVIDFLQLPNWPVFNVADICINVGALVVIIQVFRGIRLDGTREER